MKKGAVAVIDALGFRGIYRRHDPDQIFKILQEARTWILGQMKELYDYYSDVLSYDITFLSDTVVFAFTYTDNPPSDEAVTIGVLGDALKQFIVRMIQSDAPLAYRGAIAFGEYEILDNFLLGPAIDEAASVHELAEGAFIWLTPSAKAKMDAAIANRLDGIQLSYVEYDVPLKGGLTYSTYAVSPVFGDKSTLLSIEDRLRNTFSQDSIEVSIKMQNSMRFFQKCRELRGLQ